MTVFVTVRDGGIVGVFSTLDRAMKAGNFYTRQCSGTYAVRTFDNHVDASSGEQVFLAQRPDTLIGIFGDLESAQAASEAARDRYGTRYWVDLYVVDVTYLSGGESVLSRDGYANLNDPVFRATQFAFTMRCKAVEVSHIVGGVPATRQEIAELATIVADLARSMRVIANVTVEMAT